MARSNSSVFIYRVSHWILFVFTLTIIILVAITLDSVIKNRVYFSSTSGCSDGNSCTVEYMFLSGCLSLPVENGLPCSNICYTNGVEDFCQYGVCQSSSCAGSCSVSGDCPLINGTDSVQCIQSQCIYTSNMTTPNNLSDQVVSFLCKTLIEESLYVDCVTASSVVTSNTTISCFYHFICY